jgi:outer membrane protein assembly factor BamE (lipoprotein component of BamABCDE complex)
MKGIVISFAAALVLAGCMSSGKMVTEQQASQFQRGITTRETVMEKLGEPSSSTKADDGTRVDIYMHIEAHANAVNYIPIVGLLAGSGTGHTNMVSFTYDKAGILSKVETTTSTQKVNTGLLNQ